VSALNLNIVKKFYRTAIIPEQIAANPDYKNFRELFYNIVDIHTSGHADKTTIKKVIETINSKEVIIIHKEGD
jgi:ribonuclease J